MKAIVQDKYGSAEVLEAQEIDKPEIGENEVLVLVMAGGVIRPATIQAPPAARRRIRTRPTRYFIR